MPTVKRFKHIALLKDSLDQILAEPLNPEYMADAVEARLFRIGVETFTVGSKVMCPQVTIILPKFSSMKTKY